ncbi:MAG: STAS domain-containing protein [Planctomycetaceae bacterium]|nr:STAS domain-containing protein [Planctomycetaceae bacterium]
MEEFRYIRVDRSAGSIIIQFKESNLSIDTVAECIRVEIEHLLEFERPQSFIVDFTDVRSISSSVISMLLKIRKTLMALKIPFALCCVPVPILEIYRTLQLTETHFRVYETISGALEAPRVIDPEFPPEQLED